MLLRALDPLVDYHQIDHALVNFGVNMSTTAEDENYTLVRHESCFKPEFSISLLSRPPEFASLMENVTLNKISPKSFKIQSWKMVRECH